MMEKKSNQKSDSPGLGKLNHLPKITKDEQVTRKKASEGETAGDSPAS
jgi:hypothetical protein